MAKDGTNSNCITCWPNLDIMQVALYLAGEITQVKESIPWVRCASGNVFSQPLGPARVLQKLRLHFKNCGSCIWNDDEQPRCLVKANSHFKVSYLRFSEIVAPFQKLWLHFKNCGSCIWNDDEQPRCFGKAKLLESSHNFCKVPTIFVKLKLDRGVGKKSFLRGVKPPKILPVFFAASWYI